MHQVVMICTTPNVKIMVVIMQVINAFLKALTKSANILKIAIIYYAYINREYAEQLNAAI